MRALALPLALCVGAGGAQAQAAGRVTGTVTGPAGQPLAGATVVLDRGAAAR